MLSGDLDVRLNQQLDELRDVVKWCIGFAFTFTILAVQGEDNIGVFELKLSPIEAFTVGTVVYLCLFSAVLVHLRRMVDLLTRTRLVSFLSALDHLGEHPWMLNPFTKFKATQWSRLEGHWGASALATIWWFCVSGLFCLLPLSYLSSPLLGFLSDILAVEKFSFAFWWQVVLGLWRLGSFLLLFHLGRQMLISLMLVFGACSEQHPSTNLEAEVCKRIASIGQSIDKGYQLGLYLFIAMIIARVVYGATHSDPLGI